MTPLDDLRVPLVALLCEKWPALLAIYAFGSQVSGHADEGSDLDLAVLHAGRLEPLHIWNVSSELAARAGCDVDLVDLSGATTVMQYRIVTTGVRWWTRDSQVDLFEAFVLSEKTALDEARDARMQDVLSRGRVHG